MTKFTRIHSPSFTERRKMLHNLVFFANFLLGLDYGLIMPTAWSYLQSVNAADPFYFGLMLSGFSLTALIGGLICGETCKFTARRVRSTVLFLNVCPLVGNVLYFVGINVWYIVGGRSVAGMGVGVVTVIYNELCKSTPLEERKQLLRHVFASRQIGMALSPAYVYLLSVLETGIGHEGILMDPNEADSFPVRLTANSAPGFFLFIAWALFAVVFHAMYDSPRCICGRPASIPASPVRREFMLERAPLIGRPRGQNWCHQCLESCPSVSTMEREQQHEDEEDLRLPRDRSRSRSASVSSFRTFTKDTVVCLLFMQMLGFFCQSVVEATVAPTLDFFLNLGPLEVSFVLMALGLETLGVFLLFVSWSKKHPRRTLLAMGLILGMTIASLVALFLTVFYMAEVEATLEVFPVYAIALCFLFLAAPGISIWTTSLLSRHVPRSHQGKSVLVRRVCNYLGSIVGPLWGTAVVFRPLLLYGVTCAFVLIGSAMFFISFSDIAEPFVAEERKLLVEGLVIPEDLDQQKQATR